MECTYCSLHLFKSNNNHFPKTTTPRWKVFSGTVSEITFTDRWDGDIINSGVLSDSTPKPCSVGNNWIKWERIAWDAAGINGTYASQPHMYSYDRAVDTAHVATFHSTFDKNKAFYFPRVRTDAEFGFTVTLCYCPNYRHEQSPTTRACETGYDFIQNIGKLHMWTYLVCNKANWGGCGYVLEGLPLGRKWAIQKRLIGFTHFFSNNFLLALLVVGLLRYVSSTTRDPLVGKSLSTK